MEIQSTEMDDRAPERLRIHQLALVDLQQPKIHEKYDRMVFIKMILQILLPESRNEEMELELETRLETMAIELMGMGDLQTACQLKMDGDEVTQLR